MPDSEQADVPEIPSRGSAAVAGSKAPSGPAALSNDVTDARHGVAGVARTLAGAIYLRNGGELIALTETAYESEDILQTLLADHPGLLAGDEIGEAPRRWILLSREVGIADQVGAAGRWSLDHLFVDQDAVPTLVEVKRSSDTRIRREVVGQLLEYAANGTRYWPVEQLRALFETSCATRNIDPDHALREALGDEADTDAWWAQVETNLRLGRLRLVFVADVISRELRRIIEFLNEQMTQTEVIGVEIRQYVDASGEHQTLVPRLIGQTESARDIKHSQAGPRRRWDIDSWLAAFSAEKPAAVPIIRRLFDWARHEELTITFGSGALDASARFNAVVGDATLPLFGVYTQGPRAVEVAFAVLARVAPFDALERRQELRDRLKRLPHVQIPDERLDKWPNFDVMALAAEEDLATFTNTISWVLQEIRERDAHPEGT